MEEQISKSLRLEGVVITLEGRELLSINETIDAGNVLTIMGPSGSGKSSLLAYIAGFLEPAFIATGNVFLNGKIITILPSEKRKVGLLFQDAMLFPHMSVGENLNFAISKQKAASKKERFELVEQALEVADLKGYADRDPATLSGGQKSRVALMRVLLSDPHALLLDEAFSKLDAALRGQIRDFVFKEAKRRNLPVLMVTHDEEDAKAASGAVIVL